MPIKFAEVSIIRNIEKESIFNTISRYLGNENKLDDNDTIIITFDDGTFCDTRDDYRDLEFTFATLGHNHIFPIYFEMITNKNTKCLFYKNPFDDNGLYKLKFDIFKNYKKYKKEPSKYNMIYEDIYNKEIFSIVKIPSNEEKPRFVVAYDDTLIDKSIIIYLTETIFKEKFT